MPVVETSPPPCPTVTFKVTQGACNVDGFQPVQIVATITPPAGGTTIQANLVRGTGGAVLASGTNSTTTPTSPVTITYSQAFPTGSYTFCVEIIQPSGCPPQCTKVTVSCTGACCLADGSCRDGVTKNQCQNLGGNYMGHGTTCATVNCSSGNGGGTNPCTTTFRWWFCPLLFALMTFGTAIGLGIILLATCPVPFATIASTLLTIGGVFLAIGILTLLLYLIFCTACLCGWFYLFLWRVLFGVGVIVTVFAGCCPNLFWPGLLLIALGILFLYLWRNTCHIKLCPFLSEIVLVLAVYVLPIIAFILGFPGLAACMLVLFSILTFNFTFLALVTLVLASIVAYQNSRC